MLKCPEPVCAEWDGSEGGGDSEILASRHLDVEVENLPTHPERSSASASFLRHVFVHQRKGTLRDYGVGSSWGGDCVAYY